MFIPKNNLIRDVGHVLSVRKKNQVYIFLNNEIGGWVGWQWH
jgi:hypothetical protein